MTMNAYRSAEAFKQALEQRLRTVTTTGVELARRRQLVVFDRFLARVAHVLGDAVTLKGGLVLELRLARARSTKDVDLRMMGTPSQVLERLRAAATHPMDDFMSFDLALDARHPEIAGDGVVYEGRRFRAECRLAGKVYGQRFAVDVAFGDPIFGEPDLVVAKDTLGFAGLGPPSIRVYPVETHIAEKLHAYTLPRRRPNTRVKDLPDMALLATTRALDAAHLRAALDQTFAFRSSHGLPTAFPVPPSSWATAYETMAREDELPWSTLASVAAATAKFIEPVLEGKIDFIWDPHTWIWKPR